MKRLFIAGIVFSLGFCLSGCLDITSVIAVNKDGSGTITETMYIDSKIMQNMIIEMGAHHGEDMDFDPFEDMDDDDFSDRADEMGEGVSFVASKRIKKADGSEGMQMVYAFKNIDNLKYKLSLEELGPGMGGGGGEEAKPITFKMSKGESTQLVINMPKWDVAVKEEDDDLQGMRRGRGLDDPKELAMMRQVLQGFRFRSMLKLVDGEIGKTNAKFTGVDSKTKKKSFITFLDMDLGKIAADPDVFSKIAESGPSVNLIPILKAKEKAPDGFRLEPAEKIEVEIK